MTSFRVKGLRLPRPPRRRRTSAQWAGHVAVTSWCVAWTVVALLLGHPVLAAVLAAATVLWLLVEAS